jgi:truncated hemoglobin YjbI
MKVEQSNHRADAGEAQPLSDDQIATIVQRFYATVLHDQALAPRFDGVSIERIESMQRELFAAALGDGPMRSGGDLYAAHAHLHLQPAEVSRFFGHLVDTLELERVDRDTVARLVDRLSVYIDEVLGNVGEAG